MLLVVELQLKCLQDMPGWVVSTPCYVCVMLYHELLCHVRILERKLLLKCSVVEVTIMIT